MIKIDDTVADYVMTNYDIFECIPPNLITGVGILCNYFIFMNIYNVKNTKIDMVPFALLLLVRFLADILDGAVARKYKKTSKMGNILDTVSDLMLMFVGYYLIMIMFDLPNWTIAFFILYVFILNEKYKIFEQHDLVKSGNNGIMDWFMNFTANNTIVQFVILFVIAIWYNQYALGMNMIQ